MPSRIEITLKKELLDPEGESLRRKAKDYFGFSIDIARTVNILTIDKDLSEKELVRVRREIFTNPVTQLSDTSPIDIESDWIVWVGYRPGVRDNAGATAMEAITDLLGVRFAADQAVYTSKRYCLRSKTLKREDVVKMAEQLLANDIIQQWKIFGRNDWDRSDGIGYPIPKVILNHLPTVTTISIDSEESLRKISDARNLSLNSRDIPVIRSYFIEHKAQSERSGFGLSQPTDVELEYISQARSDHCNHNTFRGRFYYSEEEGGNIEIIDNLFKTFIEAPTLELQKKKSWVVSVLWDNAGVGRFDENHLYVITGETHNSPSNMEAYGGAITGIVGVYRDPLGTGKGSKLIMGSYGFCVGPRDYDGELKPKLHPRRLLDGVIEGVRDGGNKSGVPTMFGQVLFHPGYMGKCLVYVTAIGIMPAKIAGEAAEQKTIFPEDLIVMCGGRVGKDGIHGVTASSETFSEHTPAGHVQIGDPYTQKKMHDFLLEARDSGLIRFITDNGGGGLSSSVGESARFSNGCFVELEKVPLKYEGLDQWEIWVSESQERMTVAIAPENHDSFFKLAAQHAVECTVIGKYTDTGKLHISYQGKTCAYIDLRFLEAGFPQWEFEAQWRSPSARGMVEPVIGPCRNHNQLLLDILSRPNICSKAWITRQYDHEVQGTSVLKPLVGVKRDLPGDAAVLRPVLKSTRGLAFSQALLPFYSQIDAYHMTTNTIDEAVRRIVAVGGDPDQIGGVDNFCWPNIQYDPHTNPGGRFKAAQLVRSCRALKEICLEYGIPLLSGKDSMYVDGHLQGRYGIAHKVSGLESLQFSATSIVPDIRCCTTMEVKMPEDLVYILGVTRNELGGSEYYDHFGYVGCNVPQVFAADFMKLYRKVAAAIEEQIVSSVHGVYRGGLAVHMAMVAMGGDLGIEVDLSVIPINAANRDDVLLYSESPGRFIVTIDPRNKKRFDALMAGLPATCIGAVTAEPRLVVRGQNGATIIGVNVSDLKQSWQKLFGGLI